MGEKANLNIRTPKTARGKSDSRIRKAEIPQPAKSPADHILFLQGTIGNRAVQRLIESGAFQAKSNVGDIFDQKNDLSAGEIMNNNNQMSIPSNQGQYVQCREELKEDEDFREHVDCIRCHEPEEKPGLFEGNIDESFRQKTQPAVEGKMYSPANADIMHPVLQRMAEYKFPKYDPVGIKLGNKNGTKNITISGQGSGDVNIYEISLGTKDTRKEAIEIVADKAATIGAVKKDLTNNDWKAVRKEKLVKSFPLGWTKKPDKLNKDVESTVDPFVFRAKSKHKEETGSTSTERELEMDYQMADFLEGYVIRIKDGARESNIVVKNPVEHQSSSVTGSTTTYSQSHYENVTSGLTGILSDTEHGTKTKEESEKSWDAYTKLAGEGARFHCVKAHINNIQDDSLFYTEKDTTTVYAISFVTLWKKWQNIFGSKYNIPDIDVKTAITTGGLVGLRQEVLKTALKTKDYNLG